MRACSIDVGKVNLGVYIEEFTKDGEAKGLYLRRVDLTEKKKERVTPQFLARLFSYLDSISELLQTCDYIIIEKQLRANPEAQFVDHALQSYFVVKNHNGVTSFSSKNKTRLFDSSKMTKYQRKKWSTKKALQMLHEREEKDLLDYAQSLKKKDDVSDAICQLDAWKVIKFGEICGWKPKLPLETFLEETSRKKKVADAAADPIQEKPKTSRKKKVVDAAADPIQEKPKTSRKKKEVDLEADPIQEKPKTFRKKKEVDSEADPIQEKPKTSRKKKVADSEADPIQEKPKTSRKKKVVDSEADPIQEKPKTSRKKKEAVVETDKV